MDMSEKGLQQPTFKLNMTLTPDELAVPLKCMKIQEGPPCKADSQTPIITWGGLKKLDHQASLLLIQTSIDSEIMSRLDALEASVLWIGQWQEAFNTRLKLSCVLSLSHICVTSPPITHDIWNDSWQGK